MSIDNAIKSRRSVYPNEFNKQGIEKNTLRELIEIATYAPNHKKTEPWRFKVFQGESLHSLADFLVDDYEKNTDTYSQFKTKKIAQKVKNSAAVIAIILHRDIKERLPEWEEIAAVSCAVQNLWIAAHARGIGGYWSSPSSILRISEFLKLQENEKCLGFFYMGYFDDQSPVEKSRLDVDQVTEWI